MGYPILIIGVALWWVAHLFKRLMPRLRAAITARTGEGSRGIFAALLLLAIVFMSVGYREAEYHWLWLPQPWMYHLNNLLVLIAFYIFGIGMARGELSQKFRHPMLTGTLIWALAHLMLMGHLAGLILFGGLGLWAVVAMAMINIQEPAWRPKPPKGGWLRDLVALPIVLLVFWIAGRVHAWLGVNPFGAM
ncbi:NnrU family protein [Alkalilacustris brevis]|uniref:NnrU family protein n=1 Tax=Alkalilacustris brevis TaxID=2026338 RepID=UPI000E0E0453|nr:NnrU family protein [Alkalilacustris brevis]